MKYVKSLCPANYGDTGSTARPRTPLRRRARTLHAWEAAAAGVDRRRVLHRVRHPRLPLPERVLLSWAYPDPARGVCSQCCKEAEVRQERSQRTQSRRLCGARGCVGGGGGSCSSSWRTCATGGWRSGCATCSKVCSGSGRGSPDTIRSLASLSARRISNRRLARRLLHQSLRCARHSLHRRHSLASLGSLARSIGLSPHLR